MKSFTSTSSDVPPIEQRNDIKIKVVANDTLPKTELVKGNIKIEKPTKKYKKKNNKKFTRSSIINKNIQQLAELEKKEKLPKNKKIKKSKIKIVVNNLKPVENKGKKNQEKFKVSIIINPCDDKLAEEDSKIIAKYLQIKAPEFVQRYMPLQLPPEGNAKNQSFIVTYNLMLDTKISNQDHLIYHTIPLKTEKDYQIGISIKSDIRKMKKTFSISRHDKHPTLVDISNKVKPVVIRTSNINSYQRLNEKPIDIEKEIEHYQKYKKYIKKDHLHLRQPIISSAYQCTIFKKNSKGKEKGNRYSKTRTIMKKYYCDLLNYRKIFNSTDTKNILNTIVSFIRAYVDQLYSQGIIHKDVKPENTLLDI